MSKDTIKEIKERISVLHYARDVLGFPVKKEGDRWASLKPSSTNKTCCIFNDDYFMDYNLGMGGDVIDLCALAKYNGDKGKAIRELAGLCGLSIENSEKWKAQTQELCGFVGTAQKNLTEDHRKYLNGRGFTDATIKRNKLGSHGGSIIIPCFTNNHVSYYSKRQFEDGQPKYKHLSLEAAPIKEMTPWGYHTLTRIEKPLIVAEGIFDAMTAEQAGYQAISPLGGSFSKNAYKKFISICKNAPEVVLVFDNDENGAGQSFLLKMARKLFNNKVNFHVFEFEKQEDLNEHYVRKGHIDDIFDKKMRGIEFLAGKIDKKDDFQKFIREASVFVGRSELAEIFDIVKTTTFKDSPSWLKQVEKDSLKCPAQSYICDRVLEKRQYMYNAGVGFMEYSTGCWRYRPDEEILRHIGLELGQYRTGSNVKSVLTLVKSETNNDAEFNRNNCLNFMNGTFDLLTGKISQHSPEDMSSIQLKYAYDPSFPCDEWKRFIYTIVEGDEEKYKLLQEIAGYVLFPNNSLQKAFILIGGGSNGKSVYLEVLRKVFGDKNCTSIELSNLNEDFQKIRLMDSFLNISSEMKSSVAGAEAIFKQIVAGDSINGCKKHHQNIEFTPRVKMICAANALFKAEDLSYGFIRRLLFIKFNLTFQLKEDDIKKGTDRLANINLQSELETELPGIFNWCYEGFKRLKKQGRFSDSDENKEIVRELIIGNCPASMYIKQLEEGEFERNNLFISYNKWRESHFIKHGDGELGFFSKADQLLDKRKEGGRLYYINK
jgi:P4 family phage/plasmid primase-like protien